MFLNLIDLARSSLEDEVFASESAGGDPNESVEQFETCSDPIMSAQVHNLRDGQSEIFDSDCEIEKEIEELFANHHSDTTSFTGSISDLFALDVVDEEDNHEPNQTDILTDEQMEQPKEVDVDNKRPAKIVWSSSVEFEGQMVELDDLVSQEELEMWSAHEPLEDDQKMDQNDDVKNGDENEDRKGSPVPPEDVIDEHDIEEFDLLVQDLSDDGSASLGGFFGETEPDSVDLIEGQPTECLNLVIIQGDRDTLSRNSPFPDCDPNSDCERAVSSGGSSCEYFYERRQAIDDVKQRKTSQILKEKVQVFDELDRRVRKRVETTEEEQDWGSLGVKFENRGVVRDLVWMWEYNHLQQSGRRGVYPELDERPKKKTKPEKGNQSGSGNDLEPNAQQEQAHRTKKKRKKVKPEMESEKQISQSDPASAEWAWWQIGILFWLVVFSFFILSSLPDGSLSFFL